MENFLFRGRQIALRTWTWFKERAHGSHATFWLAFVSFSEASLFLVTPEVLLVPILLAGSSRWKYYAFVTTVWSVLGGIAGYAIGAFFFDVVGARIADLYQLHDQIARAGELFNRNTFWVIFTAAFTPLPYKVFVLAGGFFKVNFLSFVVASLLGRALRFYLVAYIVKRYGEQMVRLFFRYVAVATVVLVLAFLMWVFFVLGLR